jgi:hypothetical protein
MELGISIVATGLAAYVGYKTQGLVGAEIAAVVPAYVSGLFATREENLMTVTEDATNLAGMDGADLVAWIKADERHAAFFTEALEAAWNTLDRHKLRTLSYVLADGFQDDARLDIDQLLIGALRELQPGHVRVLRTLAEKPSRRTDRTQTWSTPELRAVHPGMEEGIDSILATMQTLGCILAAPTVYPDPGDPGFFETEQDNLWVASKFGLFCLNVLRKATIDHDAGA